MQPSKAGKIMRTIEKDLGRSHAFVDEFAGDRWYSHTGFTAPQGMPGDIPLSDSIQIITWRKPTMWERVKKQPREANIDAEIARVGQVLEGLGYLSLESELATEAAARLDDPKAPQLLPFAGNDTYRSDVGKVVSTIYLRDQNPQR